MKKTVNVNIGSMAYIIDEDAFAALNRYLEDVKARIAEENPDEIMDDIESRIADIFSETISNPNQVVNYELVRKAMAIIGRPEYFGERKYQQSQQSDSQYNSFDYKKLYRSRSNQVIAGICGGIADFFGIDVSIVRVVTFLLIFFGGLSLWVYIALWIIIPYRETTTNGDNYRSKNDKYERR